ncbi:MAG: hypothetical protein IPH84_19720 [Bacteroidales bacterium]|nr:hypothetical protein [Bacteroidales bacterium]
MQNTCQGQATQFTDQTSLNGGPTLVSTAGTLAIRHREAATQCQTNPVLTS